jgi:hypothetical protein
MDEMPMPPVKPTGTQSRAGENVVPRPTPTQEENDLAALGVHINVHDWDGTPLQNPSGESPDRPDRPELPPPVQAPVLSSLNPSTADVGSPDLTMVVNGTGFTSSSVIVWNGGDEPTTFGSASQVSTIVKPSTASGPYTVPIAVRNGDKVSNELQFQFTETIAGTRKK